MRATLLALALVAWHVPAAHAFSACTGADGWAPRQSDVLAPHPHLVYWTDRPRAELGELVAMIDGWPVVAVTTIVEAPPYRLLVVDIMSGKTGTLELRWKPTGRMPTMTATYKIVAKTAYPKDVHGKTSRFDQKLAHSTVREVFDGLEIALDAPATRAYVKIRRDDKAPWQELDVPVTDGAIRIGEIGCKQNYTPGLLESGVDIEVEVERPDGTKVRVDTPAHVVLPKLATPTSDKP